MKHFKFYTDLNLIKKLNNCSEVQTLESRGFYSFNRALDCFNATCEVLENDERIKLVSAWYSDSNSSCCKRYQFGINSVEVSLIQM